MDTFVLNIFPAASLSSSVITTVWVGVWVVVFFNLRFGWVLSGLVVPGYLVPLLMVKPWAVVVTIFEGSVVYLLVYLYSERLSTLTGHTNFFGRDRFFALLLVSVLVRLLFDAWIWPLMGEYLNQSFGLTFDYRNHFHSFGLIVVALIGNQFWKPGLIKGIIVLFVTVSITYFLVRYLLVPFTNFHTANLNYMYENLAVSMLAGPKAYIIMLTSAYLASHLNLRYGWEYSGIMVPALLSLQWYQPAKIVITFVETFVILLVAIPLLKLPIFQKTTMEGARKLLFFFNIGFFYEVLLGHLIIRFFPQHTVTDYFGFGYLLTTLMAVKMHDKEIVGRLTRSALQTSLMAVIIATVIGFSLTYLPGFFTTAHQPDKLARGVSHVKRLKGELSAFIKTEQLQLYQTLASERVPTPFPHEINFFQEALTQLAAHLQKNDQQRLSRIAELLNLVDYEFILLNHRFYILQERVPRRGWGTYIIDDYQTRRLQIQVPEPINEWGVIYSGLALFKELGSQSLAIAGSSRRANPDGSADVLGTTTSFFYQFQQIFGRQDIIQVRGVGENTQNKLLATSEKKTAPASLLLLSNGLGKTINLSRLKTLIGDFNLLWQPSPYKNSLRSAHQGTFTELFLTREDRRTLLFRPYFHFDAPKSQAGVQSIVGYIQDHLLDEKEGLARKDSNQYVPPRLEDLLFWDREILTPLIRLLESHQNQEQILIEGKDELTLLNSYAGLFGYQLQHYQQQRDGENYLILAEKPDQTVKRYWGTYVFRLQASAGYLIEVPRVLSERFVFEYGISLFDTLRARVLLLSGAHPKANLLGHADIIRPSAKQSLFTLVQQVMLRETTEKPNLVIQCRAFRFRETEHALRINGLMALQSGVKLAGENSPLVTDLRTILQQRYGLQVRLLSGKIDEAGYEVGRVAQALYLPQTDQADFVTLWLSPLVRHSFRQFDDQDHRIHFFQAVGIATTEIDFTQYLAETGLEFNVVKTDLLKQLQADIQAYIQSRDIIVLKRLVQQWPDFHFQRMIDINTKQPCLLVTQSHPTPHFILAANLFPFTPDSTHTTSQPLNLQVVLDFLSARTAWLLPPALK